VRRVVGIATLGLVLLVPAFAQARPAPLRLAWADCWPRSCQRAPTLTPGARMVVAALGVRGRLRVELATRRGRRTVAPQRRSRLRWIVRLPADARTGRLRLRNGRRRSNWSRLIRVVLPRRRVVSAPASGTAFDGAGMWIWVLARTEGGNLNAIAARARANGVSTVFLKSSDAASSWAQFSPQNVATLRSAGLHVCAWQYVYGNNPQGEAAAGVRAVQSGAECLVIDAEAEYEGKYRQAQAYVQALRTGIGASYPLALAGFPYVDFHRSFPFSVFLGPGAAQFNLPQMYWKAIGTTVDNAYAHTWPVNRVYQRPIFPLGQLYQDPAPAEIARFRTLAAAYGASGVSWWDWQEATPRGWEAIAAPLAALGQPPPPAASAWPRLASGSRGDLVIWVQEHLVGAGATIAVDGAFGAGTAQAVRDFQSSHGLAVTGAVDAATWPALLQQPVAAPNWASPARAASAGGRTGPPSARLPARRYEIPPPWRRDQLSSDRTWGSR
jgi:hypothetical protein